MLKSYFTAALRNFSKNKLHTFINVLGLSVGLTATLLALIFVLDEQSFDTFHTKGDRLYRINKIRTESDGSISLNAESSGLYGPGMEDEFPEVEATVLYQPWYNNVVLSRNDKNVELKESEIVFVDEDFFEVFDFYLTAGIKSTALSRPETMVLTPGLAQALFGNEDPIGKTVKGINGLDYEVTGIAAEAPRNSHIQFKALVSFVSTTPQLGHLNFEWMNNWHTQTLTTYVLLKPSGSAETLRTKLRDFTQRHLPERVDMYDFYLQPFKDIYLDANEVKYHRMSKVGNRQYVYMFSVVAGILLFIACINYINISTSRSTRRSREVGMRKSLGATRRQLVNQFLGESFLVTLLSASFSIMLLYIMMPVFNDLAGKSLEFSLILNQKVVIGFLALLIGVSFVSGIYPALILSAFRPAEVLKSNSRVGLSGNLPRHVLITFQFVISIIMIASALIVYQQMHFILSKDLGFDKEHVLVLNLTQDLTAKGETFEQEVANLPGVVQVSRCRTALGGGSASTFIIPEGLPPDQTEIRMFPVDGHFQQTYGLSMAMGRFFDTQLASDSNAVVINEALMRQLKWNAPLTKTIKFEEGDIARPIIGVVKDFNFHSLYQEVEPLVMWLSPNNRRNLSIRFAGNPAQLITALETKWKQFESRYPFHYYFVDQAFAKNYEADDKLFKAVIGFAGLSIFIACLGLYGLVSFTIEQRTKEFGIRKVFGASVMGLSFMVNKKFLVLVVIASFFAVPAILPLVKQWLAKFAFRIEVGPLIFVEAIAITLAITVAAVSIQAIRAAMINPAKALRSE